MNRNISPLVEKLVNDESFANWVHQTNKNDESFWDHWIHENFEKIDEVEIAKEILLGLSFKNNELEEDYIEGKYADVLNQIQKQEPLNSIERLKRTKFTFSKKLIAVAASVLLIFIGVKIFRDTNKEVVHQTAFGEIMNLTLADGTIVELNGNSEIRYQKDNPRKVYLNGEAYFKVKKKPSTKAKFWVITKDLNVEVYGTDFNVNTRLKKTNVLLDEGAIKLVLSDGVEKNMLPGELISYSKKDNLLHYQKIDKATNYASWANGTFIFNKVSLLEVMQYLKDTYGLSYQFETEALKGKVISGGIPNQNLKICLLAIQKASNTTIIKEDQLLLIKMNTNQN